jgi:hypothetical protein
MRIASACACLLLAPITVSAQPGMSKAEAAQLYTAAGFPMLNDQPVNRCGKPAKPRVTFVDINGDKRPEALFTDADARCYAPSGRYFAVLAKEGATWRSIVGGNGSVRALASKTAGFPDMRVTDSGCVRDHHYDGRTYKPATTCSGQALVAEPQPMQPVPGPPAAQTAMTTLQAADEAAAFKTAGFKRRGGKWRSDCEDPDSSGAIESADDLNGDGLPDVVITESGTLCYGNTGQRFWLVSKLANGGWRLMTSSLGIPEFLKTKGVEGWPDVLVGGPGFCFPAERWNGKEYKLHRWEYDGKVCKR